MDEMGSVSKTRGGNGWCWNILRAGWEAGLPGMAVGAFEVVDVDVACAWTGEDSLTDMANIASALLLRLSLLAVVLTPL